MTILKLVGVESPILVKESYQTIKRRVFTNDLFFEVTIDNQKVTLNKTGVKEFREAPKKTEVAGSKKNKKSQK